MLLIHICGGIELQIRGVEVDPRDGAEITQLVLQLWSNVWIYFYYFTKTRPQNDMFPSGWCNFLGIVQMYDEHWCQPSKKVNNLEHYDVT
jgi:hypothetical protein